MTTSWRPKDAGELPNGLILFDGVCVLCSRSVQFVLRRDRDRWFRFAPIQSPYGRALALRFGISPDVPETNAVIVRGRGNFKADSASEVLRRLPLWTWARVFPLVPRRLRDFVYDRVAQNRYRLFGRTESCLVPAPDLRFRFIFDELEATEAFAGRLSPFQVLLGDAFARLPPVVRRAHALNGSLKTAGCAEVSVAKNVVAQLLCWVAGLPAAGRDVPVTVAFHADGHLQEFWDRRFGERRYASTMRIGDPRAPGLLVERFGPFDLEFRLEPCGEAPAARLNWSLVSCRLLGLRLPRWACPMIECVESGDGERFLFDIDVVFPLIGRVIHYSGWLTPQAPDVPPSTG
jgi:predicted DCC family thiol-disulfide oxidoreductase YuxK